MPPRHPAPPADLSSRSLPLRNVRGAWWRIYWLDKGPRYFGRAATFRWDDPLGLYGVFYAAEEEKIAFIETLMHSTSARHVRKSSLVLRGLARVLASGELKLVDLSGAGLGHIGADNNLCTNPHYSMSQRWSRALYEHPEAPDGIYYRSRRDPSGMSVALFDRSDAKLRVVPECGLADASFTRKLGEILDHYQFGLF